MLRELRSSKEIAVDLEHHDTHSYHGIVSLMQISTRNRDWLIDTLQPWREDLQVLNEVFTDPSILKVLHGSTMDVIWLQRDLGLYLVGLFDTFHASSALGYPKKSLKYLLEKFVQFQADKRYQKADWRVRPLPSGMFDYARSDTHYLLYVFDHLRNELVKESTPEHNLIDYVLEQSKQEALQRYERLVYDAVHGQGLGGWSDYLTRSAVPLTKEQFAVFKAVHQWRDEVARAEDEGVAAVFPKHILFRIAQVMPLDEASLFQTISPVSSFVKDRAPALLGIIKSAKEAGTNGPEWRDTIRPTQIQNSAVPTPAMIKSPPISDVHGEEEEGKSHPAGGVISASRLKDSQFWGSSLQQSTSYMVPVYSLAASREALRLSLPIPSMPTTVTEVRERLGINTAGPVSEASAQPPQPPPPKPSSNPVESMEIFTIKDMASVRKRKVNSGEVGGSVSSLEGEDLISINPSDGDEAQGKSKSKKTRKSHETEVSNTFTVGDTSSRKQIKSNRGNDDSVPFDYSTAPSVLHSKPELTTGGAFGKHSRQTFNPYTKALDTSTGLRRPKKETSGKTFTFRD